jgi:hypothetical protein
MMGARGEDASFRSLDFLPHRHGSVVQDLIARSRSSGFGSLGSLGSHLLLSLEALLYEPLSAVWSFVRYG